MAYETDEQQVEALKAWWAENGRSIVLGASLGLVAILAWQGWQRWQLSRSAAASEYFGALQVATDVDAKQRAHQTLVSDYIATPYAGLGGLELARAQVEAGELEGAEQTLAWVAANAVEVEIAALAALRRARVLLQRGELAAADAALPAPLPGFVGLRAEVVGDIALAGGDRAAAREAYRQALDSGEAVVDTALLRMKHNDLAPGDGG